jgi:hypothetical protein
VCEVYLYFSKIIMKRVLREGKQIIERVVVCPKAPYVREGKLCNVGEKI